MVRLVVVLLVLLLLLLLLLPSLLLLAALSATGPDQAYRRSGRRCDLCFIDGGRSRRARCPGSA